MTTWVALLRGVNLGPHKKVAMADLRALLADLGFDDVRTHLQSGNALFRAAKGSAPSLERAIERGIEAELGVSTTVLLRNAAQLTAVVGANPFVARHVEEKQLHVVFTSAKVPAAKAKTVAPDAIAPDEFAVGDRALYVRLPNGVMGSRLPNWDRVLGLTVTMRTWRTVTRLQELATA
jgi:uncharacterized protein (DUF1697 family)